MHISRINSELKPNRLNAEYYSPQHLDDERLLSRFKTEKLDSLRLNSCPITYGILKPDGLGNNYRVAKAEKFEGMFLSYEDCEPVSKEMFNEYSRSEAKEGDVLIAIGGYVGRPAIVGSLPANCKLNVNRHLARLRVDPNKLDPYFLVGYLSCSIGNRQLVREVTGSVQAGINLEDLRLIDVPVFNPFAQKYIGDKVRQAERLRAWAKQIEIDTHEVFNASIAWNKSVLDVKNYGYVKLAEFDGRLDLKYNSPERLAVLRHLKKQRIETSSLSSICSISAMIGWKGLTTKFYRESGPWLLRGVEFKKGVIDKESLVCVDEFKYNEQPQIHLKEGDLAFSKDGTIGKAIVIPKLCNRLAAGSTIARLRMKGSTNPYYLEFVLSHSIVQAQIESFATGIAQPHITQEWIAKLEIPRVDCEEKIAEYWNTHHLALNSAKSLTKLANLLVEDLIEGQLTESQLVSVQQALEAGDDSLDRALLERMTAEGIDGEGDPLFDDIEQLYDLLEQAKQALEADDTMAEA